MYTKEVDNTTAGSGQAKNVVSLIIKIILLVCLVCFFLPFVTVSCGGTEIETYSGIEVAMGSEVEGESMPPNVFVIIALLATIVSFIAAFIKTPKKKMVSLSFLAFTCMVLFMLMFRMYYGLDEDQYGGIEITYKIGVFAEMILQLTAAILTVYYNAQPGSKTPEFVKERPNPGGGAKEPHPAGAASVTCPSCGGAVSAGNKFCEYCGTPVESAKASHAAPEAPASSATCPSCGGAVSAGNKFCEYCGTPVVGTVVAKPKPDPSAFEKIEEEIRKAKTAEEESAPVVVEEAPVGGGGRLRTTFKPSSGTDTLAEDAIRFSSETADSADEDSGFTTAGDL